MTGNAISFVSMLHTAEYAVVASDHMTRILSAALAEDWHVCSWDLALCRFKAGHKDHVFRLLKSCLKSAFVVSFVMTSITSDAVFTAMQKHVGTTSCQQLGDWTEQSAILKA